MSQRRPPVPVRYPPPKGRLGPDRKHKSYKDDEEEKEPTRIVRIEKQIKTAYSNEFAFDDPAIVKESEELLP